MTQGIWDQAFAQNAHNHQALGGAHSHALHQPYTNALNGQLLAQHAQALLNQRPANPTPYQFGTDRSFEVFEQEFKAIREALAGVGVGREMLEELLKEVRDLRAQLRDALAVTQAAPEPKPGFPARALQFSR